MLAHNYIENNLVLNYHGTCPEVVDSVYSMRLRCVAERHPEWPKLTKDKQNELADELFWWAMGHYSYLTGLLTATESGVLRICKEHGIELNTKEVIDNASSENPKTGKEWIDRMLEESITIYVPSDRIKRTKRTKYT